MVDAGGDTCAALGSTLPAQFSASANRNGVSVALNCWAHNANGKLLVLNCLLFVFLCGSSMHIAYNDPSRPNSCPFTVAVTAAAV